VNDRRVDEATGEHRRFRSSIIPPWARKSPKVAEVLPLMYLHGTSSKDFAPALEEFFGSSAGLSASVVTRLTAQWQDEAERFSRRSLADREGAPLNYTRDERGPVLRSGCARVPG